MKWPAIWLGLFFGHLAGAPAKSPGGCRYLELHAPGAKVDSVLHEIPLYLAVPDSLGQVSVPEYLEAKDTKAENFVHVGDWRMNPPSRAEIRYMRALRQFMQGHIGEAGKEIAALTRDAPATVRPSLHINRGLLMLLSGFPDDAEKEWMRAEPKCAEGAWKNLYSLYLSRNDFSRANGLVEEAIKENPKSKWANFAKGYLLRMLAPGDDWENFLRAKSSWSDSLFEIQIAYGKFLKEKGMLDEAAKYYSRGLEGAPVNGPAWLELADVYYRLGLMVFAQTCVFQALHFGISDPYVFELLSRILQDGPAYSDKQRWHAAEQILEEGFPHDLASRNMAQLLYHVYCHNGKVEAAYNLKETFWFHFNSPGPRKEAKLGENPNQNSPRLPIRLSFYSYPLVTALADADFVEPF